MKVFEVKQGKGPIILAQPHGGTMVPEGIFDALNDRGRSLTDTDWHITRLYDGLLSRATVVRSLVHRYVIDTNRDPDGHSLYPSQNTTNLVPLTDFDGNPIWKEGREPDQDVISQRKRLFHRPYHDALAAEIARVKRRHGIAIVFDCHSIRSDIPFLFEGRLPAFNVGTNHSTTCHKKVEKIVFDQAITRTRILNGRFLGGYTTRHYGQPEKGVHAIQLELAQRAYMEEKAPWRWNQKAADETRPILKSMLDGLSRLALSGAISKGKEAA